MSTLSNEKNMLKPRALLPEILSVFLLELELNKDLNMPMKNSLAFLNVSYRSSIGTPVTFVPLLLSLERFIPWKLPKNRG